MQLDKNYQLQSALVTNEVTRNANKEPAFLISSVRSGSTLLRLMLDSHPEIVNPGEFDFLFDKVADNGASPDITQYHEWLSTNRIFQALKLDIDPSLDYTNLINSFVMQVQKPDCVLMLTVHRHFYRIPKIFPRSKYIHLIRDGRDVAKSCIGMGWVGNVYYGIDFWNEAEVAWDRLKETLPPSQYLEIKYEYLIENSELVLGQICQFLGFDYSNRMMDYASKSTYSLPDRNLRYQWKTKYNRRELSLVESKAGELLVNRGYELSGVYISGPSLIEKMQLHLQHKSFRTIKQISRYGFLLFFQSYLARKIGIKSWERSLKARINAIEVKGLK
jgi:hypothetical protein